MGPAGGNWGSPEGAGLAWVEEILAGNTGGPEQRSPAGPELSEVWVEGPLQGATGLPEQVSDVGLGWSTADAEEPAGGAGGRPSSDEMVAGLVGETSVNDLASEWGLTEKQVEEWAGQLAQGWWDWSIETPVEQVRAELRSPGPEPGPAEPLPELTEPQLQVLGALRDLKLPHTVDNLAYSLKMSIKTVRNRLKTIGEDLSIAGTPNRILAALGPRLRDDGDLARLEMSWRPVPVPPPGEVVFTEEQTWMLAAMRHLRPPTVDNISTRLGVPPQTLGSRLVAMGLELHIKGSATEILTTLVSRVLPPGELSNLDLPWPPPDRRLPSVDDFSPGQMSLLVAVRDLMEPTPQDLACELDVGEPAVRSRVKGIGVILGIEGTVADILSTLALWVHPPGRLVELVSSWPPMPGSVPAPPSAPVVFTPGQTWVLAAVRKLKSPTAQTIADELHLPKPTITNRLGAIGQRLGIMGTPTDVLTTLISWVHPPGDLSTMDFPWPPPDQPVRDKGRSGNRKRRYPGASGQ